MSGRYQITVYCDLPRVMLCWQVLSFLPCNELGVPTMPKVDRETGQGYIVIDRYDRSAISNLVHSWLTSLVALDLATSWSYERLEVDGDVTMLEIER